jgi:putative ABC transport system substrate-binding protein
LFLGLGVQMRRRDFIIFLGGVAAAWPLSLRAQQAPQVRRIGYLSSNSELSARDQQFIQGLRELGYVDGKNILIEYRFAGGKFEQLPALAAELARLNLDVIVARVTAASLAAKAATGTIPIVMLAVSDPIASGLVASLARSGNNITGTSSQIAEVQGKSLELIKEIVPDLNRVAVLWNPGNAIFQAQMLQSAREAAIALGLDLHEFGARNAKELDSAFEAIRNARVDALLVLGDPILRNHRTKIIEFAAKSRLPAIYATEEHAEGGGLMTYGPDMDAQFERGAIYVDKILKGAKPADLPIEQPTKFKFSINLKTAKALGLQIPPELIVRADKVIE